MPAGNRGSMAGFNLSLHNRKIQVQITAVTCPRNQILMNAGVSHRRFVFSGADRQVTEILPVAGGSIANHLSYNQVAFNHLSSPHDN